MKPSYHAVRKLNLPQIKAHVEQNKQPAVCESHLGSRSSRPSGVTPVDVKRSRRELCLLSPAQVVDL